MWPAGCASPTHYVFSDMTGVPDMSDRDGYVGIGAVVVESRDALRLERRMWRLKGELYPGHGPCLCLRGTEVCSGTMRGLGGAVPAPYSTVFEGIVGMLEDAGAGVIHVSLKKDGLAKSLSPGQVRKAVWEEFFTGCDAMFGGMGGAVVGMVHDRDAAHGQINGLLRTHVGYSHGCRLVPHMRFHGSGDVGMLQAADIVAYVERKATEAGTLGYGSRGRRAKFVRWSGRLHALDIVRAGGGPRTERTPP